LGARESIKKSIRKFSNGKSLIGNGAEFENDASLNREPMKGVQEWDKMEKPRRPCDNPS